MRIGIIGGGPAGCAAAVALASTARTKEIEADLTMIETRAHTGGRTFPRDNPALSLNTSAGVSSVDADDPDGFVKFLNQYRHANPAEFARRSEAADYLQHSLEASNRRRCRIRRVHATASAAQCTSDGAVSVGVEGEQLAFDALVLATGAPFRNLLTTPSCSYGSPYRVRGGETLAPDAPVLIVGTSLSAIDACVSLHSGGHQGPVLLLSRSGRLPAVRRSLLHNPAGRELETEVACRSSKQETTELRFIGASLAERLRGSAARALQGERAIDGAEEFLQAHDESEAGVTSWECLMMSTIDILNRNWKTAIDQERSRFQRDVGDELNRYISAMPLASARTIRSMISSGQLQIVAGSLDHRGIPRHRDGTEIAGGTDADVIINATGLAPPVKDPFIASLQRDGLVSINGDGGVSICSDTGRVHGGHPIYAVGPVTKGSIYTTNFLYSSAQSARTIAKAMFGVPLKRLSMAS